MLGFSCGNLGLCFSWEENATDVRSGRVSEPMRESERSQRNDSPFCKTPHNFTRMLDRNAQLQVRASLPKATIQSSKQLVIRNTRTFMKHKREERLLSFSGTRILTRVAMTIKGCSDGNQNVNSNLN